MSDGRPSIPFWRQLAAGCSLLAASGALYGTDANICTLKALPDETREALVIRAHQQEGKCHHDADFLFAFGQLLSSEGLYDLAVDRLEGAIMRRPDHWPARIEYAIALEGAGDRSSAESLLAELETDPALPEALRTELQVRRRLWQSESVSRKLLFRSSLTLLGGYDNNLLGSPRISSLSLTLPNGTLPVTLSPNNQPIEGSFARFDWRQDIRYINHDGSYWNAVFAANLRYAPGHSETDFSLWGLGIERIAPGQHGPYIQMALQNLNTSSGDIYRLAGVGSGWDLNHQAYQCRSRLGLEAQYRYYPQNKTLNGQYAGLLSQASCPVSGWSIRLRTGLDHAEYDNRPGGDQWRAAAHVGKTTSWDRHQVSVDIDYEYQRDELGYSPLLENNLRRRINKTIYRIEYTHLNRQIEPVVGIEWLDQRSNIKLFATDTLMAYFGLRWLW